jgi:hypothetical protein
MTERRRLSPDALNAAAGAIRRKRESLDPASSRKHAERSGLSIAFAPHRRPRDNGEPRDLNKGSA